MPRPVPVQPATKVAAVARGAKKVGVPPPPPRPLPTDTVRQPDVKWTQACPLCIEELDETEKVFYPCPCGYQVCLFCYERVKGECGGLCPGCRREYGEPVDAPTVKQVAEAAALHTAVPRAAANNGQHNQASNAPCVVPNIQTPRPTAAAAMASKLNPPQQRGRGQEGLATYAKREDAAALPTGATWAAAGTTTTRQLEDIERTSSIPSQAAVDESAWPSLADSTAVAAPAPAAQSAMQRLQRPNQSFQSLGEASSSGNGSHRRSTSASSASADGMPSNSSSSQDLQYDTITAAQQYASVPHHLMDAFATAQVSSTVHGVRHSVNVPLPVNTIPPMEAYPEAVALKTSMQQAVKAGTLDSKQAAARLIALLRQKDAESGAGRSLLAAGKAPPGFSAAAPLQAAPSTTAIPAQHPYQPPLQQRPVSGPTNQDPLIPGPPLGRYNPIQPPLQHGSLLFGGAPGRQTPTENPHQSSFNGLQNSNGQAGGPAGYSMWSGLPGIELTVGFGSSIWQGLPATAQQPAAAAPAGSSFRFLNNGGADQSQGGNGVLEPAAAFPASALLAPGAKPPPPGFGYGSPYSVRAPSRLATPLGNGNVVGQGYNPLLAGLTRPPPVGMTAYRPQLGTGI